MGDLGVLSPIRVAPPGASRASRAASAQGTAGTFRMDHSAYSIRQDSADWRWSCTLSGEEFATGTEPTEGRAVAMAQVVRRARFTAEVPTHTETSP